MDLIKPREVTVEESVPGRVAKIVFEPLERGVGTTLGNSIRRMLLSSLPGAAVTAVRFDGIMHEFDTINGVREDVIDIILSLKELDLKMHSDDPQTISLDVKGPAVVTAGSLKCPADVQVLNPDLVNHLIQRSKNNPSRVLYESNAKRWRNWYSLRLRCRHLPARGRS